MEIMEKNKINEEDPEINKLFETLTQTFSSSSTHKIKEAEEKLKQFDYIIINKLDKIFKIFATNGKPLPCLKALSIRIKYIFISLGKSKTLQLNELQNYIELLINTLINTKNIKHIHISIIEQICEAIKVLINSKLFKGNEELLVKLNESILSKIMNENSYFIFSILYLIVLSPNININNINGIITQNFVNAIKKYITSIDMNQTIKILDLISLCLKKLLYLNQAKYMITNIINTLFDYLFRILLDYCSDENIVSFINDNLLNDEQHIKQKSTENILKSKIFLAIGYMIECDKSINNDNSLQNKKLIEGGLLQIIRIIYNSFEYIIKEQLFNIDEYYIQGSYEIIIYQAFSLIIKCISSSPFQKEFYNDAKNFVIFKIFPFLTLDLGEKELFKESPDEYYLQVIDTMSEFSFRKIKTICGKCLTLICENYPDLSFIILNIIFELLIFFMEEFDKTNLYKYILINNEIGEFFIDVYTNESIINACLLCISILAKQAIINSELKKSLHKFLLDNQMRLENVASDKIQFKLCLLYGLFLDNLFNPNNNEDKEFIKTAINFLLSIILYSNKTNERNGLSYQAYHSLEQISDNNYLNNITNDIVKEYYYKQIIQSIPNYNLLIFIDMINLFIEKLPCFKNDILNITNFILDKIKNDLINKQKDNNRMYSDYIHKEMSVISNIIKIYNNPDIEKIVCEFIIWFINEYGNNNEFIEKVMNIFVNFSSKKNKIELVNQILNDSCEIIIVYYNSSLSIDLPTFKLINYLMLNNSKKDPNVMELLKNVVLNSLSKIEDNFYGRENIIYTLLLIICWLIIPHTEQTKENDETINSVVNIISTILNKLNNLIEKDKIDPDFDNNYLKYLYLVIIFSSFIYYSNYSFNLIYDKNSFNFILNCINDIAITKDIYFSLKLNKLIIFGLSKILYENDFLKLILVNFKDSFILDYNLISKQLFEEAKEEKKKDKIKEGDANNEDDEECYYLTSRINKILNNDLIFPKLDFDEFEVFIALYKKLIEINETKIIINKILEEMNEKTKKDFKNILIVQKIIIKTKKNDDDTLGNEKTEENIVKIIHRPVKPKNNLKLS